MSYNLFSRSLAAALIVTLSIPPSMGWAGQAEALDYYNKAMAAYQGGKLQDALNLLERAYAEDPNLVYQYNRILVLRDLKRYDEALRLLDVYYNPMREDAENRFSDISEVKEKIVALKKEADEEKKRLAEEEAKRKAEEKRLAEEEAKRKAEQEKNKHGGTTEGGPNWLAWGLIGGGGLLLAGGALTGSGILIADPITRLECANSSDASCYQDAAFSDYNNSAQGYTDSDYDADLSTVGTFRGLTIGLLAAGGVAAITGTILLLMQEEPQNTADASASKLQLIPYASPDRAGALLRLDF